MANKKFKDMKNLKKEEREKKMKELKFELVKSRSNSAKKGKVSVKEIKKMIARLYSLSK